MHKKPLWLKPNDDVTWEGKPYTVQQVHGSSATIISKDGKDIVGVHRRDERLEKVNG